MKKIIDRFVTVKSVITLFLIIWISIMVKQGIIIPEWYLAAAFYPVLQSLFNKDSVNVNSLKKLNAEHTVTPITVNSTTTDSEEVVEETPNPEEDGEVG